MAEKEPKVDPIKLKADLIKTIKNTIDLYSETVKEIRSRELKKAELCLLCGNEDKPGKCTCLVKNDVMGYGDAGMMNGGAPSMAMSEDGAVQGAKSVNDKPETGAEMPSDGKHKFNQDDAASGGEIKKDLTKDERLAGLKAPGKAARTVAALRHRATNPETKSSLQAIGVPGMGPPRGNPLKMMGKKEDSYSQHKVEVNMKEYKKNPDKFPGGKKQAIAIGLSEGREHAKKAEIDTGDKQVDKRLNDIKSKSFGLPKVKAHKAPKLAGPIKKKEKQEEKVSSHYENKANFNTDPNSNHMGTMTKQNMGKGPPVPPVREKMGKTSVEEANKELQGAKSVASRPIPGMGTKVVNNGPLKPVSGTIKKGEYKSRLKEVLGKCALCKDDEHVGKCMKDEPGMTAPPPTGGLNDSNHNRRMLKIKK